VWSLSWLRTIRRIPRPPSFVTHHVTVAECSGVIEIAPCFSRLLLDSESRVRISVESIEANSNHRNCRDSCIIVSCPSICVTNVRGVALRRVVSSRVGSIEIMASYLCNREWTNFRSLGKISCEYFVYNLTFRRSWKSSTYRVMFGHCLNKAIVVK